MIPVELDTKLTDTLYQNIPGFEEYARTAILEGFHNNSYFVFSCLGSFLLDIGKEDNRVSLIFQQVNKACELQNNAVEEMLYTTFLEYLTDEVFVFKLGEKELKGRAKELFNTLKNSGLFIIPD